MKKLFTTLLLFALPILASTQIKNPVKWSFASKKNNDKTYELHMTAAIDPGWHLYAQEAGKGPANITKGAVEFMVCNDHQCLPPKEIEFAIDVGGQ